jgi:hypothetical protein
MPPALHQEQMNATMQLVPQFLEGSSVLLFQEQQGPALLWEIERAAWWAIQRAIWWEIELATALKIELVMLSTIQRPTMVTLSEIVPAKPTIDQPYL